MIKLFEFYSQYIWPFHRFFVSGLAKRCRNCILSERCVTLYNGVCKYCTENSSRDLLNLEIEFDEYIKGLVNSSQGNYDVVLLFSGGKDSTFLLYYLRKKYPQLRILCVNVDNGFTSNNFLHIPVYCEADLFVDSSHHKQFRHDIRNAFLSGNECYGSVDFADGSLIFEIGNNIAESIGVSTVIGGLTHVQAKRILDTDNFVIEQPNGLDLLLPFVALQTSETYIRKMVQEWGFFKQGKESPLSTNSDIVLAMGVVDCLRFGYSSFEYEFAQLVREGKAERKWWIRVFEFLEFVSRNGWLNNEVNKQLKYFDLNLKDLVK